MLRSPYLMTSCCGSVNQNGYAGISCRESGRPLHICHILRCRDEGKILGKSRNNRFRSLCLKTIDVQESSRESQFVTIHRIPRHRQLSRFANILSKMQMKACKSLEAYNYFVSGWVGDLLVKEARDGKVVVFARVSELQFAYILIFGILKKPFSLSRLALFPHPKTAHNVGIVDSKTNKFC